jgi:hypothetical protein
MSRLFFNSTPTARGAAGHGARLGFGLALLYGFAFALYAIVRSSLQIKAILTPGAGLFGTLAANALAILMPALGFALLLGMLAAVIESVTLLLVYGLSTLLNLQQSPARAAWIGLITAGIMAGALQLFMQRSLGSRFDALWPSGYLFWLGLPCLIFVGATTWISWRVAHDPLNLRINSRLTTQVV